MEESCVPNKESRERAFVYETCSHIVKAFWSKAPPWVLGMPALGETVQRIVTVLALIAMSREGGGLGMLVSRSCYPPFVCSFLVAG